MSEDHTVLGAEEIALVRGARCRVDHIAASIDGLIEGGSVPLVGPGIVSFNIDRSEGPGLGALCLEVEVIKLDTIGTEVRTGHEEIDRITCGAGSGKCDLLADVIDTGPGCGDGDATLLNPHPDLITDAWVHWILDADCKHVISGALVGVELDGTGATGGGLDGCIRGGDRSNAGLTGDYYRVLYQGKVGDLSDIQAICSVRFTGGSHGETLAADEAVLVAHDSDITWGSDLEGHIVRVEALAVEVRSLGPLRSSSICSCLSIHQADTAHVYDRAIHRDILQTHATKCGRHAATGKGGLDVHGAGVAIHVARQFEGQVVVATDGFSIHRIYSCCVQHNIESHAGDIDEYTPCGICRCDLINTLVESIIYAEITLGQFKWGRYPDRAINLT